MRSHGPSELKWASVASAESERASERERESERAREAEGQRARCTVGWVEFAATVSRLGSWVHSTARVEEMHSAVAFGQAGSRGRGGGGSIPLLNLDSLVIRIT